MNVLETKDLRKVYSDGTKALEGVSISIEKGNVFGLLGPNGAGKTTFVKICATQLLPSGGSVNILGYDVVSKPGEVRKRIAVVPQEARPLSLQTPYEHVLTYLITRGVDFKEARKRSESVLSKLNLTKYRNTMCANLSGGLRQRVLIAMAMSTEADLLVLDEPTIGLDPVARMEVWNLVRDYVDQGKTILLTTHYMDEAELLSDRLAIVNKGKAIAIGTPSEIKAKLGATHVVTIKRSRKNLQEEEEEKALASYGRVLRAGTSFRVFANQKEAGQLASDCLSKNLEVSVRQVNLEDAFISEVGEVPDHDEEPEASD